MAVKAVLPHFPEAAATQSRAFSQISLDDLRRRNESSEGAFLKSYSSTTNHFGVGIQQFETRPRRKLVLKIWEMEPDAGEDEEIGLDLGLDQIEDVD